MYISAISLSNGSFGLGSVKRELIDKRTLIIVNAGLQLLPKVSKQIFPYLSILDGR